MKTFPTVVTGIFVLLALGAVLVFTLFSGKGGGTGAVIIWGSEPHSVFDELIGDLAQGNNNYSGVTYRSVPENELIPDLVEAIAAGNGPDLVVFPEADIVSQENKLSLISYSSMSRRAFQDTFIQPGEAFLTDQGILGLPFTVDPLVMYWNRSLFAAAGLATPPRYWNDLASIAPKLTSADKNGTLATSAVALGTWTNIPSAKALFLTLVNQLGNTVVAPNPNGSGFESVLIDSSGGATLPADSALRYYTDFADPTKPNYSWNSSRPNARDAFIGGTLAVYFGPASDLQQIRGANPNLNFDVASVPSVQGGGVGAYADVSALAIPRGSKNISGAFLVAEALTSQASQATLAGLLSLPSARRDVLPQSGANPYQSVFENAALAGYAFLDPDPSATDSIFERMIENVSSGKLSVDAATLDANQELSALLGVQ